MTKREQARIKEFIGAHAHLGKEELSRRLQEYLECEGLAEENEKLVEELCEPIQAKEVQRGGILNCLSTFIGTILSHNGIHEITDPSMGDNNFMLILAEIFNLSYRGANNPAAEYAKLSAFLNKQPIEPAFDYLERISLAPLSWVGPIVTAPPLGLKHQAVATEHPELAKSLASKQLSYADQM